MGEVWSLLLPPTSDAVLRRQASLIVAVCLLLIVIQVALIVLWRLTHDLENRTVLGFCVVSAVLIGLIGLVHGGQVVPAGWGLVIGMTAFLTAEVYLYGIGDVFVAWYLTPILVAASLAGVWGAMGVAVVASAVVWLGAAAQMVGRHTPPWSTLPYQQMYLTFNAPIMSALYLLVACMAGLAFAP